MKFEQYKLLKNQLLSGLTQIGEQPQETYTHPLVLAYIGDAVFTLYIRMRLLEREHNKVRVLHDVGAKMVSAVMQSHAMDMLMPILTDSEIAVAKRGRNTKSSVPKSASVREYRQSTALEALFGSLFLQSEYSRLEELFSLAFGYIAEKMVQDEEQQR